MKTKLLENVKAKATGDKKSYKPSSVSSISFERFDEEKPKNNTTASGYRIGVSLGAIEYIPDHLKESVDEQFILEAIQLRIGHAIAEHVYGEVRTKLFQLSDVLRLQNRSLYADDPAMEIIDELIEMTRYE